MTDVGEEYGFGGGVGWSWKAFTLPRHPLFISTLKKRQEKKDQKRLDKEIGKIEEMCDSVNPPRILRRRKSFKDLLFPKSQEREYQEYLRSGVERSFATCDKHEEIDRVEALPDRIPAAFGLKNHGNTCFINSVVQCLSHTDLMAKYLVLEDYKRDLCQKSKLLLNAKPDFGTKGELTECLANLTRSLWIGKYDSQLSVAFKQAVEKYGTQFRGGAQHDAQEFLLWLLDKVHEDLNAATKRRYKKIKNSYGRSDEDVAAETLRNHLRCNASFIQKHFQAQFRSALSCPNCLRQSSTFDPFLCLSVPIPRKFVRNFYITVLYLNQQPKEVKLGLGVNGQSNVRELKDALARDAGVDVARTVIAEIDDSGFHRTFIDSASIDVISDTTPLYALEFPAQSENDEGAFLLLSWCNVLVDGDTRQRFGGPFVLQVSRETSYEDLQKLFLKEMTSMVTHNTLVTNQKSPLFNIKVLDLTGVSDSSTVCYLDPNLQLPLYMECVETSLSLWDSQKGNSSGPAHIKLELEWDSDTKERYIVDSEEKIEEHSSVKQLQQGVEEVPVTLEECLELYTSAERLSAEDAWHCPSCNRKQEGVKTLGLWSLPDVLVIHLKRFRQSTNQRTMAKLSTVVDFPLHGLDMSSHVSPRSPSSLASSAEEEPRRGWLANKSSWSRMSQRSQSARERRMMSPPSTFQPIGKDDDIYDLYAVCNHHGTDLQGGHYTATCRNPVDGKWYDFDDVHVGSVEEKNVVTSSAYLLFYRRRSLGSSIPNYHHWSLQLPEIWRPPSRRHSVSKLSKSSSSESSTNPKSGTLSRLSSPADKKMLASEEHIAELNGDWGTPDLPRKVVS